MKKQIQLILTHTGAQQKQRTEKSQRRKDETTLERNTKRQNWNDFHFQSNWIKFLSVLLAFDVIKYA